MRAVIRRICVFSGSNTGSGSAYVDAARSLGQLFARVRPQVRVFSARERKGGSDTEDCCEANFAAGMYLLDWPAYQVLWTEDERIAMEKCLKEALDDCVRRFKYGDKTFLKRPWEKCLEKYFIFRYP